MAVSTAHMVVPGKGTVFVSAKNAPLPADPLDAFTLTADTVATNWRNIGHTSKTNAVSFEREGGEAEVKETWLDDAARTVYGATTWSVNVDALQYDADNLDLAFGGAWDKTKNGYIIPASNSGQEVSMVILAQDNTSKLLVYIPNVSVSLREAPNFSAEEFMVLALQGKIQSADSNVLAPVNGKPGVIQLFKSGLVATP